MDPVLLDFPMEINTDRLWLHVPRPGEGKKVNEAIRESVNELKPWLHFAREVPEVEDTEKNIREAYSKYLLRKNLRFHIYHQEDRDFLGVIGLNHINWDIPKFEIYYWMRTSAAGKGYMSEAAEAVNDFAFRELKANRVEIRVATKNAGSRKIPEKLGYTLEGILRNEDKHSDGHLMDMCVYAKVPGD
ncbi:MAG TPA: GNAT family N-acetyltransferase [Bacillales bacterium]